MGRKRFKSNVAPGADAAAHRTRAGGVATSVHPDEVHLGLEVDFGRDLPVSSAELDAIELLLGADLGVFTS